MTGPVVADQVQFIAEWLMARYGHPDAWDSMPYNNTIEQFTIDARDLTEDLHRGDAQTLCGASAGPGRPTWIPCMLPAGHDSRAGHWSTSGCAGGQVRWEDPTSDHNQPKPPPIYRHTTRDKGECHDVRCLREHVYASPEPEEGRP